MRSRTWPVVLIVFVMVFLAGCQSSTVKVNEKRGNDVSQCSRPGIQMEEASRTIPASLRKYQGHWYAENYREVRDQNGDIVPIGTEMILSFSGEAGKIELVSTSEPPVSRFANIEAEVNFENGVGKFSFDDDGWGNNGKGAIYFKKDQVAVEIQKSHKANGNWGICEGMILFYRNKH